MKRIAHVALALALAAPFALARPAALQSGTAAAQGATELDARLAAIETAIDGKRRELGIPGVALAIVKDDEIVYMKGLGLRNIERNLPVTPDTLFAIGSSSKAFTAMGVVMAADEGRLSLDDPPRKHLSYFKLQDPEADAKLTVRDLLSHRSGLNRTDLGWASGVLTSDEIIQVAARAKPTAKIGEKFQYQNVMFLAAGEISARVQKTTWDALMAERIFKPLGMKRTVTAIAEMQKSDDFSLGYEYNFATKETRHLPMRDLNAIAPAGAINSSARDMAQWVRLMLGGGAVGGNRLVSEKGFGEIVAPQMKIGKGVDYGLGWFLRDWNGRKVVEHGGNIDGFNALVALMPEKRVGFVLLTNVTASPLGAVAMQTIWTNLAGDPNAVAAAGSNGDAAGPAAEAGTYRLAEAGVDVTVAFAEGRLTLTVPGQPTYTLENVGGRRYRLAAPAPDGFFVTFRAAKEGPPAAEAYLEQPHGNYVLPKKAAAAATAPAAAPDGAYADLVGTYSANGGSLSVEVAMKDGKPTLVVPGQPAYPLVERAKDTFAPTGLPDSYGLLVSRDAAGKVTAITLKQPQGDFTLARAAAFASDLTAEELMAKVVEAMGGEASLRRQTSRVAEVEVDFEHQGIAGSGTVHQRAPGATATELTFLALGKKIGASRDYFDGAAGGEWTSFTPTETYAGKRLEDVRVASDFYEPLNWRALYKSVEIKRKDKVGDEEVYVVVKTPEKGSPVTDYVSAKSFLVVKRDSIAWSETMNSGLPVSTTFRDYRAVDGVMLPFTVVTSTAAMGDTVVRVKSVKHNVAIPDAVFRAKP